MVLERAALSLATEDATGCTVVTTTNEEYKQGALLGRRSIHRITSAKAPTAWLAVKFSAGVSCEVQASFCVVIGIASAAATPFQRAETRYRCCAVPRAGISGGPRGEKREFVRLLIGAQEGPLTDCVGWWRWLRTRKFAGRKGDIRRWASRSLKNALSSNYCQKPSRRRTTRGHNRRRKRHHQGPRPSQPVRTDVRDLSLSNTILLISPELAIATAQDKLRRHEIIASITTNRASTHQRQRTTS